MRQFIISIFVMHFSCQLIGQVDSTNWNDVNDFLNYSHDGIPSDSILSDLEIRYNLCFSSLLVNIISYSVMQEFDRSVINAIEKRTMILVDKYFEIGKPIKIIKEGGVGGGGNMRVENSLINGKTVYIIVLSQSDLILDNEKFENDLIDKINKETTRLINSN